MTVFIFIVDSFLPQLQEAHLDHVDGGWWRVRMHMLNALSDSSVPVWSAPLTFFIPWPEFLFSVLSLCPQIELQLPQEQQIDKSESAKSLKSTTKWQEEANGRPTEQQKAKWVKREAVANDYEMHHCHVGMLVIIFEAVPTDILHLN